MPRTNPTPSRERLVLACHSRTKASTGKVAAHSKLHTAPQSLGAGTTPATCLQVKHIRKRLQGGSRAADGMHVAPATLLAACRDTWSCQTTRQKKVFVFSLVAHQNMTCSAAGGCACAAARKLTASGRVTTAHPGALLNCCLVELQCLLIAVGCS